MKPWTIILAYLMLTLTSSCCQLLTPEDAREILDKHNDYRRQESAANMYLLHWNMTLQERADGWAQKCNFKHERNLDIGENLFFDTDHENGVFPRGLKMWHDEKLQWRYTSGACVTTCHYTQIVTGYTTTIGCSANVCPSLQVGSQAFKNAMFLVCYYYPRGNFVGHFPFVSGAPCSKCGQGDTCSNQLCVSSSPESKTAPDFIKNLRPIKPFSLHRPIKSLTAFKALLQTFGRNQSKGRVSASPSNRHHSHHSHRNHHQNHHGTTKHHHHRKHHGINKPVTVIQSVPVAQPLVQSWSHVQKHHKKTVESPNFRTNYDKERENLEKEDRSENEEKKRYEQRLLEERAQRFREKKEQEETSRRLRKEREDDILRFMALREKEAQRLREQKAQELQKKIDKENKIKEMDRQERERQQRQRLEKKRMDSEREEKERLYREQKEKERLQREHKEKQRLEIKQQEKERLDKERLVKVRLEKERLEKQRLEKQRLEKIHLEKQRLEREYMEKERLEKERMEKERLEKEHIMEKERLEKERIEKERLEKEHMEKERQQKQRLEKLRLEKENIEKKGLQKERIVRERLEKENVEKERLDKLQELQERETERLTNEIEYSVRKDKRKEREGAVTFNDHKNNSINLERSNQIYPYQHNEVQSNHYYSPNEWQSPSSTSESVHSDTTQNVNSPSKIPLFNIHVTEASHHQANKHAGNGERTSFSTTSRYAQKSSSSSTKGDPEQISTSSSITVNHPKSLTSNTNHNIKSPVYYVNTHRKAYQRVTSASNQKNVGTGFVGTVVKIRTRAPETETVTNSNPISNMEEITRSSDNSTKASKPKYGKLYVKTGPNETTGYVAPKKSRNNKLRFKMSKLAIKRAKRRRRRFHRRMMAKLMKKRHPHKDKFVIDRTGRRCVDRLPKCSMWIAKCRKSAVVTLSCPLSCGKCGQHVDVDIKQLLRNASHNDSTLFYTKPHRGNGVSGYKRRYRKKKKNNLAAEMGPQALILAPGKQTVSDNKKSREFRKRRLRKNGKGRKNKTRRNKKGWRKKHRQSNTELCRDDPSYIKTCRFWAKRGFCQDNQILKTVFCRWSCGECE